MQVALLEPTMLRYFGTANLQRARRALEDDEQGSEEEEDVPNLGGRSSSSSEHRRRPRGGGNPLQPGREANRLWAKVRLVRHGLGSSLYAGPGSMPPLGLPRHQGAVAAAPRRDQRAPKTTPRAAVGPPTAAPGMPALQATNGPAPLSTPRQDSCVVDAHGAGAGSSSQRLSAPTAATPGARGGVFSKRVSSDQTECGICLGTYQRGEMLAELPCAGSHRFHKACLARYLHRPENQEKGEARCPLCRSDLHRTRRPR